MLRRRIAIARFAVGHMDFLVLVCLLYGNKVFIGPLDVTPPHGAVCAEGNTWFITARDASSPGFHTAREH